MARVMIFVQHPRHVSTEEAETWLNGELEAFVVGDGIERVEIKRLLSPALRFSATWSWMVELHCRDLESAREAIEDGPGLALIADLRLLGMHPSIALVANAD